MPELPALHVRRILTNGTAAFWHQAWCDRCHRQRPYEGVSAQWLAREVATAYVPTFGAQRFTVEPCACPDRCRCDAALR